MIIYLATTGLDDQAEVLNECRADHRLLSFWYIKDKREGWLKDYVTKGIGRYVDEEAEKTRSMLIRDLFMSKEDPE